MVLEIFMLELWRLRHPERAGAAPVAGDEGFEAHDAALPAQLRAESLLGDFLQPGVAGGVAADVAGGDLLGFALEGGEGVGVGDGADHVGV